MEVRGWPHFIVLFLIVIACLVIASWLSLFIQYVMTLDRILTPSLFGTLAGLSLAAATFLSGAVRESYSDIDRLHEERLKARNRLTDTEIMRVARFPHPEITLNQQEAEYHRAIENYASQSVMSKNLVKANKQLIMSFYLLAWGLVETLTLDALVDSSQQLSTQLENISFIDAIAKGHWIVFTGLDIVIGTILIFFGIALLLSGARNIAFLNSVAARRT